MTTLTITSKGQITLKKEILVRLGIGPGDQVEAFVSANGEAILRPVRADASLDHAAGLLSDYVTRPVSIEEISQTAAAGWTGLL
jgi:AbrB family looped-hinge helix DNA binding protein